MAETREQLKERERTWECPYKCWSMGICSDNCPSRMLAILNFSEQEATDNLAEACGGKG